MFPRHPIRTAASPFCLTLAHIWTPARPRTLHLAIVVVSDGFDQVFPVTDFRYRRLGQWFSAFAIFGDPRAAVAAASFVVIVVFGLYARYRSRYLQKGAAELEALEVEQAMSLLFPTESRLVRPAFRVAHRRNRARNRTGDFYNWFERRDGSVAIYCVDVEGHGELAADTGSGRRPGRR